MNDLVTVGGLGVVGYFGYRWWQKEQVRAAFDAETARLQAGGMSLTNAVTNAAAGACTAAAAAYKVPPETAGPMCTGAAIVALKAAELTAKGAIIAGKVIGKGTVVAGKAIGHAGAAVGKGVAKGTVAVAYKAPKKIIGGTVNAADKVVSKVFSSTVGKIAPAPVKKVAAVAKKIVKKTLCFGVFCGLEGIDDYAGAINAALADAGPRNPTTHGKPGSSARGGNPFHRHHKGAAIVGSSASSVARRSPVARNAGRAYYDRLFT